MLVWITYLTYYNLLFNRNTIFVSKCFYYGVKIYLPTFNIQQMYVNSASEENQVTVLPTLYN